MTKRFQLKAQRIFSEDLRRQIVGQIERKELTVLQAVREYGIGGKQTVYTWLYKYSTTLKKGTRMVEQASDEFRVDLKKSFGDPASKSQKK